MTTKKHHHRRTAIVLVAFYLLVLHPKVNAFVPIKRTTTKLSSRQRPIEIPPAVQLSASRSSNNNNNNKQQQQLQTLETFREQQTRLAILQAQLSLKQGANALQEVFVVGRSKLVTSSQSNIRTNRYRNCVVLSVTKISNQDDFGRGEEDSAAIPGILLPLTNPAQLKLLSFAKASRPLSKSVLLGLNALLVNRDGALFDNLPWSLWSVDPQKRNYDASGNPINPKFHLGKRDAYNRMMGKDWQGRSASIGNLALRLKYLLEEEEKENGKDEETTLDENSSVEDSISRVTLAQRILELQVKELQMDLAEWDYQLALARTSGEPGRVESLERERQTCQDQLQETEKKLQALLQEQSKEIASTTTSTPGGKTSTLVETILQDVAEWTTDYGNNRAPYRGAIGYAPMLDTKGDIEGSTLPYTSPYDLLKEILGEQLNCEVIGAVLENTSLLEGTLAIGGALILRRKTAQKTVVLAGEEVTISEEEEDFGNMGGKGGETLLVECDADEALAMGITCSVPIHLEPGIWDRSSIMVAPIASSSNPESRTSVRDALPLWKPLDPELSLLEEGQARNESATERASPLRIPRTTTSLFDSIFAPNPPGTPSGMFPTDNPIQSLNEYDELTNEGKARTLMSMSNFQGKLPRPRVLRQEESSGKALNSLDELLIPLIDESARRQFLMRDAELRGDFERLEEMRNEKTKRQIAKEKAAEARASGDEDAAQWWEAEAELYGDLRADVTQDEGAYSRFLDRDEWYERSRRQQAQKLNKTKFGTLLDGVD